MNFTQRGKYGFLPRLKYWGGLLTIFFVPQAVVSAQDVAEKKVLQAVRSNQRMVIDGRLTETVWRRPGTKRFIQREPVEGVPPTEETEVWVAYDADALYVAARMHDSRPDSIVRRLGRRDNISESDQFGIGIDADFDRRTAHYFVVNAAGAIEDGTVSNDTQTNNSWDGIWDVAVRVHRGGWTAEFRIPYSQLRFSRKDGYVWGIEFYRRIQRKNEESFLVYHPRNDFVRVSRWAELHGIEGIEPPPRIEILPYIAGTAKLIEQPPAASFNSGRKDPFILGRDYVANIGADAKIGLSGDITMDLSLNPDFAQVEVDPAVINLTAYEVRYQEKRPFFIEGSNILAFGRGGASNLQDFNWSDPNLFYSRRIGRAPQASVTHQGFRSVPDRTTILGATKVSGKIDETWSFAALTALTNREYGRVDSAGRQFSEEIEPMTFYGVARTLKEFNEARQAVGLLATVTERDLREPRLKNTLNKRAASVGVDGWTFFDDDRIWVLTGWLSGSHVEGRASRILSLQRSSTHYFQRPDAAHVRVDSSATSMNGWAGRVWLDKVKGNWVFNAAIGVIHPKFEANDIGFHTRTDYVNIHAHGGYQWFEPWSVFRTRVVLLTALRESNFGGVETGRTYRLDLHTTFLNYWGAYLVGSYNAETFDDQRTRGGPLMRALKGRSLLYGVFSDSRASLSGSVSGSVAAGASGSWFHSHSLYLTWRPSRVLTVSGGPAFTRNFNVAQYVDEIVDPTSPNYGRRYLFGVLDQKTLSASIRMNWAFTPRLSFQMYVQPFFSTGSYSNLKELAQARTFSFRYYSEADSTLVYDANAFRYRIYPQGSGGPFVFMNSRPYPNFNYKSLRSNAVLRWEFNPGSTLYLVWTNEKVDFETNGMFSLGRDARVLLRDRPDNVFALKLTYWFSP